MFDPDVLIQRYLERSLTDEEAAALHDMLKADPQLGERLLGQFELDAMLHASKEGQAFAPRPVVLLPKKRFSFATLAGVAALAACITLLGTWLLLRFRAPSDEATTASVAVLTRGVNLEWEPGTEQHLPGAALAPGWLKLRSGLAQIEFYQGARVLIEGPASFRLVNSGEAECLSGKLTAQVPAQARGFRINSPSGSVVDLGTEFGMDVHPGTAELHVFKGTVTLTPRLGSILTLVEGEAASFEHEPQRLAANSRLFESMTGLDQRTAASQRTQFQRWQQQSIAWNDEPSLRLRLDFQDTDELRALQNHALNRTGVPDASIVGCTWIEGRWPGKRALEFRTVSDRVRLSIPGSFPAITMTAWVRVSGLDRMFNSLFMCEGWGGRKVHWQITRDGKVRLGVAGDGKVKQADYDTPPLFSSERFGQWTHLAVVFDSEHKQVRHYANGELIAKLPMADLAAVPVKLGVAELGNWNDPGRGSSAIRNLSGAMDEFALYAKALSNEEIGALAK